jgi:hypothetical protein
MDFVWNEKFQNIIEIGLNECDVGSEYRQRLTLLWMTGGPRKIFRCNTLRWKKNLLRIFFAEEFFDSPKSQHTYAVFLCSTQTVLVHFSPLAITFSVLKLAPKTSRFWKLEFSGCILMHLLLRLKHES